MPHFIFIQQISILNILNMLYNLHFFFSSKCRLFYNATLFDFCITHILNTGCAKIKKKCVAKRLMCSYLMSSNLGITLRKFVLASNNSFLRRNSQRITNCQCNTIQRIILMLMHLLMNLPHLQHVMCYCKTGPS